MPYSTEESDSKKFELIVRINLWPSLDCEKKYGISDTKLWIRGAAVHPANKSKDVHFTNVDGLIGLLEEWNANNLNWDHASTMRRNNHGLTFSLKLKPFTDNSPRNLSGTITNADNEQRSEYFSTENELISIIDRWNVDKYKLLIGDEEK